MPLLIMLAAGAIFITYMCWQGIKTQEAANLAARIQGQERVAGGISSGDIDQVNGLRMGGDRDPSLRAGSLTPEAARAMRSSGGSMSRSSVYGKFRDAARSLFSDGERQRLFVPPPTRRSITDQVKVVRVMTPPKVFDMEINPIVIEATAYGGEDTNMYSLPRWGNTAASRGSGQYYWQQMLQQNPGDDRSDDFK